MRTQYKLYAMDLHPTLIFNLDAPDCQPEFFEHKGYVDNEDLRTVCGQQYIEKMDNAIGHFKMLEESLQKNGWENPVVITTGVPKIRNLNIIPKKRWTEDTKSWLLCEHFGGSRITIAAKLGIPVPCIVGDFTNTIQNQETLKPTEIGNHFTTASKVSLSNLGLIVGFAKPSHIPGMKRREWYKVRTQIIEEISNKYLI
tara:strand:+ start:607 stop:1203 length:597 start_codon:yes stop_codon:yes gene_type:complete